MMATSFAGTYPIDVILQYKEFYMDMPKCIIEQHSYMIMTLPTIDAVTDRQKHPILRKMGNVNELETKIISQLNKLSRGNVEIIKQCILELDGINTVEGIQKLGIAIVKKVVKDNNCADFYAQLCQQLGKLMSGKISLLGVVTGEVKNLFGKYIENNKSFNDQYGLLIDNTFDKNGIINIISFIGYLYNEKILKNATISYCLNGIIININKLEHGVDVYIKLVTIVLDNYKKECKNMVEQLIQKTSEIEKSFSGRNKIVLEMLRKKMAE